MLEIRNLTKRYHNLTALQNVSLSVEPGNVLGILGPNGAGKSTLFKIIAGLLNPDAGSLRPSQLKWPQIGYKPERLIYPNQMKVRGLMRLTANLCNIPSRQINATIDEKLALVEMSPHAGKRIKTCSKGMRQRLGLAQALLGSPPLLLLDEPSNGLDPQGQELIQRIIGSLRDKGVTVLISSHQLHEVTTVCSHLVILQHGQVHYQNSMNAALAMKPHVVIELDKDAAAIHRLLLSIHPDIEVKNKTVILNQQAIKVRRQILSLLLSSGYDVLKLRHQHITLAEIYAQAVQG